MFLGQAVARAQIAAGRGGRHVHLLSVRAQLGLRERGYSAYCSSKGGLALLVKQHAMELAPARHQRQRRGADRRAHADGRATGSTDPATYAKLIERIPLGRIARVEDVVGPDAVLLRAAAGVSSPARSSTSTAGSRPASRVAVRAGRAVGRFPEGAGVPEL